MLIRPPTAADRPSWDRLYAGYADFYRVTQTEQMRDRVWDWLMDSIHETQGLVAERDGQVVGLAHYRAFARPLSASRGLFLDDLFVDPAARGSGAARGLISALRDLAHAQGFSVVRWITAENNYRARGLYDQMADRTAWVTYDIKSH